MSEGPGLHVDAAALAALIADYRLGEIAPPDADHVLRWVTQFDTADQQVILRELRHVWSKLYIKRTAAKKFLRKIVRDTVLGGSNPKQFWDNANLLNIQRKGQSQRELMPLIAEALADEHGLDLDFCGGGNQYIYLDDILFSGSRLLDDVRGWLPAAPQTATLHVITLARHTSGIWYVRNKLPELATQAGKKITFRTWKNIELENRKSERAAADVLWPAALPSDAFGYDQGAYPHELRASNGSSATFSSEASRHTLEQAFLKAGLRIRSFSANPSASLRPLGFSSFGVGFGSLSLTWRNCPNNAPLALWWGDQSRIGHPFAKWYPLVPRKTYNTDDA